MYEKKIYHSDQLKGLTGDNGEKWVAFFLCVQSPISSCWKWFATEQEATDYTLPKGEMNRVSSNEK